MKGEVLDVATGTPVVAVVSAWRPADRPGSADALDATVCGPDGFSLALPLTIDSDVVIRVHRGDSAKDFDPRALAAVVQLPMGRRQPGSTIIRIDASGNTRRFFGRASGAGGRRLSAGSVTAIDPGHVHPAQSAELAYAGRFTLSYPADRVPQGRLVLTTATSDGTLTADWPLTDGTAEADITFTEVPGTPVTGYRIAGRLLDPLSRAAVPRLRVEAWDKAPRQGGMVGTATEAADDGTFDLLVPPGPGGGPPDLFFRLHSHDVLLAATDTTVVWDQTGHGTVVIEVAGDERPDGDVVLHELGETIAGAVDRMQSELARYPRATGSYIIDELDLSMPVAVQIDRLGQVRTTVVGRAPAEEQLGRIRMRVRPAPGGVAVPTPDRLDQPLTVLPELSAETITRLTALRIYSVEDLARLTAQPAGRESLAAVGLGPADGLAPLLDKVALLALPPLPRPVREALLRLGITSPKTFAGHPDPAALADAIGAQLGQPIPQTAVVEWQRQVNELLHIALPATETPKDPS
ncbi:hypothetical protein PV341_22205 [Streptomyces sp. PA03-1a]|nr:hypothetical protein [Streptomyces sp. PA03-1a]MDX2817129.1 hypothetical protein [Streptomyces sp. PA03-5A]